MKVWPSKTPGEVLKQSYDWSPDLPEGVILDHGGSTFTPVVAAGTTVDSGETDDTTFTAIISGGNDGEEASYLLRVTASDGQIFEDTVVLPIVASNTLVPVGHPGDYTPPTAANLIAVFPEFATVTPGQIDFYLRRAARSVDTSWTEGDFADARILLAAHLLTLAGLGDTAEAKAVSDGSGQFRSMAISSLRLERFDTGKDASALGSTRYGKQFRNLLRANRGGPRVTGGVPGGWGDGDKPWGYP